MLEFPIRHGIPPESLLANSPQALGSTFFLISAPDGRSAPAPLLRGQIGSGRGLHNPGGLFHFILCSESSDGVHPRFSTY
jgi:hypothetical protein